MRPFAGEAKALWDRFEFVYTPKHGSWLNVAEVELSVMIRQCLRARAERPSRDRIRPRSESASRA